MDYLWNDDDVAALENDVLLERLALDDLPVPEWQRFLGGPGSTNDADVVEFRERRGAACETQRLQYGQRRIHHEHARFVDLPDDVDSISAEVLDDHRHDRLRDVLLELAFDVDTDLIGRAAGRLHLAGEREGETPVGANHHFPLEVQFLPCGDRDAVAGMKVVIAIGALRHCRITRKSGARNGANRDQDS